MRGALYDVYVPSLLPPMLCIGSTTITTSNEHARQFVNALCLRLGGPVHSFPPFFFFWRAPFPYFFQKTGVTHHFCLFTFEMASPKFFSFMCCDFVHSVFFVLRGCVFSITLCHLSFFYLVIRHLYFFTRHRLVFYIVVRHLFACIVRKHDFA